MMKTASRMVVLCHSALGNSVLRQFKNKWIKIKFSSYLPVIFVSNKMWNKKKSWMRHSVLLLLIPPVKCSQPMFMSPAYSARFQALCWCMPCTPCITGRASQCSFSQQLCALNDRAGIRAAGTALSVVCGSRSSFSGLSEWSSTSAALIRRLGGTTRRYSPGRWSPVHTCILNSEVKGEQPVKQSTVPPGITAHEEAASGPGLLPQSCEGSAWPPCHGHRAAGVLCWVVWSQGHCQSARPGLQCNPWQNFWLHQGELWEAQNDCCIQWFISVLLSVGWEVLTPIKMSDNYTKSPNLE